MTDAELEAWEATRDVDAELIASARQASAGLTSVAYSPVIAARRASGLSQTTFAAALGVSVRTLQGWEQGRRQPTGPAKALIEIALRHPDYVTELVEMRNAGDERFALAA